MGKHKGPPSDRPFDPKREGQKPTSDGAPPPSPREGDKKDGDR